VIVAALTLVATVLVAIVNQGDPSGDPSPTAAEGSIPGGTAPPTDDSAPATGSRTDAASSSEEADVSQSADAADPVLGTDPPASTEAEVDTPAARPVGECLAADDQVTDCLAPHASQVVSSTAACDEAVVSQFLGLSERDVLRPDLTPTALPEGSGCRLLLAEGSQLTGSLQAAFKEPRSPVAAQARHCVDIDLRPVSCADPHHGEVVGETDDTAHCISVATDFLGRSASSLPNNLALAARTGQSVECIVSVKGANTLTQTLRDIGQRALPIEPTS